MTTNAPVQFKIVRPDDTTKMPSATDIWVAGSTAFSDVFARTPITFMYETYDTKVLGQFTGIIIGVKYESGAPGKLLIEMNDVDNRWIKVSGYYDAYPRGDRVYGFLTIPHVADTHRTGASPTLPGGASSFLKSICLCLD